MARCPWPCCSPTPATADVPDLLVWEMQYVNNCHTHHNIKLSIKSWKECSVQLNKIWVSDLIGVVLIYGFGYPMINQPSDWMKVALWGCQLPLHRVLSEHFIGTKVWMHLCLCCLVEETSGSLEANALSNGPDSLQQAFKEYSPFSSLTSIGGDGDWVSYVWFFSHLHSVPWRPLSPRHWF